MKQPIRKRVAEANQINTEKQLYTLLVDGNNLLKISLVDNRMNDKGEVYGAVLTFLRLLGNVLQKKDFDYCIVCFDGNGSGVLRWQLYEDYKANRNKHYETHKVGMTDYEKAMNEYSKRIINWSKHKRNNDDSETEEELFDRQKMIINGILEELCVRQYEFDDVEGDDIIAYYIKNKQENEKIVIMSSDRDLTQLISDTVIIYNPRTKNFITKDNSIQELGITHENIVLEKILCGDASDNIKGVKGVGQQTLLKLFPEMKSTRLDLKAVVSLSRELLDRRKGERKKPLRSLENIVNGVTDGCQGDKLYEINQKIIDLSEPMITEDAANGIKESMYAPIDTDDRSVKNAYKIIEENRMFDLTDETKFGNILAPYGRIIMMEQRRFKEWKEKKKLKKV